MPEIFYEGLEKIAERLGVPKDRARWMIDKKYIRAFKIMVTPNAPWCCIESQISEDIKNLPAKGVGNVQSR